nr:hypothetical protein [Fodinibius sp.]NIV15460.1 hypothetical protein [Fodinibius sp.]NIY29314.1 hypothetical protein [Fodinibius sp.]
EVDYPEDSFTDDTSFIYDPAGNRWQVTGGGLGPYYATNSLNQYTSAGTVYFSYDDNGNLTGDGTYSYTYDAENRLITANASGLSIAYSYDPPGRRISKTDGGETTYYIYDGDQVICEYDDLGNLRKRFIYGVGIDEVIRMSQVGRTADITGDGYINEDDLNAMAEVWLLTSDDIGFEPAADLNYDEKINNTDSDILSANWLSNPRLSEVHFYYHYDGLGSVIAISDSVGRVVEKYQYAVYGNPQILNQNNKQLTESKYGNPYMFTGRRFDTETRLYYYRARYYSTEIGRFLQVDAVGYEDSMNLYIYVGNNPINLIDPYGLCQEKPKDLTEDEFQKVMDKMRIELETVPPSWEILSISETIELYGAWDSDYYGDNTTYYFRGRVATGHQLNYYAMGMLAKHRNAHQVAMWTVIHLRKISFGHFGADRNTMYFYRRGYNEYKRPGSRPMREGLEAIESGFLMPIKPWLF